MLNEYLSQWFFFYKNSKICLIFFSSDANQAKSNVHTQLPNATRVSQVNCSTHPYSDVIVLSSIFCDTQISHDSQSVFHIENQRLFESSQYWNLTLTGEFSKKKKWCEVLHMKNQYLPKVKMLPGLEKRK